MAVSRALHRLLSIRKLQEEDSRLALESVLGELNRLRSALRAAAARDSRGRLLVSASARTGELPDRLAGLEEMGAAVRQSKVISAPIEHTEFVVKQLRQKFFLQRVERRQAETLIHETEAQDALKANRRDQQELDNWYQSAKFRAQQKAGQMKDARDESASAQTVAKAKIGPNET
ncbi:MAG: hypothetical protein WB608_09195 [Terracidiphilus sp.]